MVLIIGVGGIRFKFFNIEFEGMVFVIFVGIILNFFLLELKEFKVVKIKEVLELNN